MVTSAFVLLLMSSWGWAQESVSQASAASVDERFFAFHQGLNATASDVLANAQRPVPVEPSSEDSLLNSSLSEPNEKAQVVGSVQQLRAVERVRNLQSMFEPILRKEGVPQQLAAVVLEESAGWTNALSPKGARGLWQLMPDTARRYGLVVTIDQDDRLSLDKSTRAAARYLRDLHEQFKDWSLVFAAYNAGEQMVQRAINRSGTTDFSRLNKLLPIETRNYVPAVWASLARLGYRHSEGQVGNLPKSSQEDMYETTFDPNRRTAYVY
jgi:soluble lytic murein transglycosylase-like protein